MFDLRSWGIASFASFASLAVVRDKLVVVIAVLLGFAAIYAGVVNIALWAVGGP